MTTAEANPCFHKRAKHQDSLRYFLNYYLQRKNSLIFIFYRAFLPCLAFKSRSLYKFQLMHYTYDDL